MNDTLQQCRRNKCITVFPAVPGKKYCSDRCNQAAALTRRRARADTPLKDAVTASGSFSMKKIMQSAKYLADCYKVDVEDVTDMLVDDMERRIEKFWEK